MKADGKKPWTIRSVLTPLGRILGHAARKGKIGSNPMQRLERGERPRVERHEMRILSREDIGEATRRIADAASGDPRDRRADRDAPERAPWLAVGATSTSSAGVIRVRRQADRKGQMVEPKTPQAKRDIVLPPTLAKRCVSTRWRRGSRRDAISSSRPGRAERKRPERVAARPRQGAQNASSRRCGSTTFAIRTARC